MALSRGFGAIKKAKKEADQRSKERSASRTPDFFLQGDGASAKVWFNGPSDEPIMALYHNVTLDGRYGTELCASQAEDHEGCVYCRVQAKGDKRVSKAKPMAVFNVFDTRWIHKRKNEEKTKAAGGQFDRFDWLPCEGDPDNDEADKNDIKACKYCKRGVERVRSGQKKTRFSVTAAGVLDAQNDAAKKKCASCGGKLILEGFSKGKKTVPDLDDVDDPEDWEPVYECRKCDDPVPRSIQSCPVEITRSGTGTNTSYNFTLLFDESGDMPEFEEADPIELEEALVPKSAEAMAEQLGISNPFDKSGKSKKSKASDYDDDDDDEDPHAEDDDD